MKTQERLEMPPLKNKLISLHNTFSRHRLKRAIDNKKLIIGRYPLNIQIQTVSACNGKCIFCPYQGSWHNKNPGRMSWEIYEKIIQNLRHFKIGKFCPYLENEPLLDSDLFKKISYAVENLHPERIEIASNLSALTEEKLEKIKEIFPGIPHEIRISFHGTSKESYEEIMGLSFENTLHNVMRLVETAQEEPLNIEIRGAGMPKNNQTNLKNWFGEEEYFEFWGKNISGFKNKPRISFFTYHDRAGSKQLIERNMSFNTRARETLKGFYCIRFDKWIHFLYTGEPILCCMDYNRETSFRKTIKDETIEELFSSPYFLELIKKGTGIVNSEKDFICKRCISPGG